MKRSRVTLYSFSFPHHGRYSSFHRLTSFVQGCNLIDATPPLQGWWSPRWQQRIEHRWRHWSEWRLRPIFARRQSQCVHYLYPENSLFHGRRWLGQHRLVLSCHQPAEVIRSMPPGVISPPFLDSLAHADRVVLLTRHFVRDYEDLCRPGSVSVIPHGVDVSFFCPQNNRPPRPPMILTVGSWLRDYEFWAEIVLRLAVEEPSTEFVVVALPDYLGSVPSRVMGPLAGRVRFLKGLSDTELRKLYREATLLFLPLTDAGANNALLESMACGLPTLVTDLPATREYAGDCAVYYPAGNRADCMASLKKLLHDSHLRTDFGVRSRHRAEKHFAWSVIAASYSALYAEVLDQTAHASPGTS